MDEATLVVAEAKGKSGRLVMRWTRGSDGGLTVEAQSSPQYDDPMTQEVNRWMIGPSGTVRVAPEKVRQIRDWLNAVLGDERE